MARALSSKVEHCPRCRKLKAKDSTCKSCGYGSATTKTHVAYTIKDLDATKLTSISINGVIFKRG